MSYTHTHAHTHARTHARTHTVNNFCQFSVNFINSYWYKQYTWKLKKKRMFCWKSNLITVAVAAEEWRRVTGIIFNNCDPPWQ